VRIIRLQADERSGAVLCRRRAKLHDPDDRPTPSPRRLSRDAPDPRPDPQPRRPGRRRHPA
jgi:hypothetical protein